MSKLYFTNANSIIKKNPVVLLIHDRNRCIHRIIYRNGQNYGFASDENLSQKIIAEAGELFLLSSPIMFYQLFTIIENTTDKEGLIESLHNVYLRYKEFHNASIKGDLEYKEFHWPYFKTVPEFNTSDTSLYKMHYDFILDDECKLQSVLSQFRCLGDYRTPVEYAKSVDNSLYDGSLTYDIVENFAELLCQSDIEEYKKLLDTMNPKDEYYEAAVNGGAKYADNIERLLRKVQK